MNASGNPAGDPAGAAVWFCYLFHAITFLLAEGLFIKVRSINFNGCPIDHASNPAPLRKTDTMGDHWFYFDSRWQAGESHCARCGVIGHAHDAFCSRSTSLMEKSSGLNPYRREPLHHGLRSMSMACLSACWHRSIRSLVTEAGALAANLPAACDDIFRAVNKTPSRRVLGHRKRTGTSSSSANHHDTLPPLKILGPKTDLTCVTGADDYHVRR